MMSLKGVLSDISLTSSSQKPNLPSELLRIISRVPFKLSIRVPSIADVATLRTKVTSGTVVLFIAGIFLATLRLVFSTTSSILSSTLVIRALISLTIPPRYFKSTLATDFKADFTYSDTGAPDLTPEIS